MTIIAYSPLDHHFQKIRDADANDLLGEIARTTNKTVAQVAFDWCLSKPGVVTIPKTESEIHLIENCQSSSQGLSKKQVARLDREIPFRSLGRVEMFGRRNLRGLLQRIGRRD